MKVQQCKNGANNCRHNFHFSMSTLICKHSKQIRRMEIISKNMADSTAANGPFSVILQDVADNVCFQAVC
jgi:hypothetical protein